LRLESGEHEGDQDKTQLPHEREIVSA